MRRVLLSLGSTAVSGLSNVLVQLVAAAMLEESAFAQFSIVAATIIFFTGLARAVVGQTDMLRGKRDTHRGPIDGALSVALAAALIGAVVLFVGIFVENEIITLVGIASLAASAFILQDSLRFRGFRSGRPGTALVSDVVVLILVLVVMFLGRDIVQSVGLLTGIWTVATFAGFVVGAIALRAIPTRPLRGAHWLFRQRDLVLPATGEYLLQASLPYALNFLVLAVGGPAALGGYRLIQLFFGLLGNLASGINAATLPRTVESRDPLVARRLATIEFVVLTLLSVCLYCGVILVPIEFGELIFGATWLSMIPFILVGSIHGWINAIAVPNYSLLRLLGYANFSFFVRVASVLATLVGAAWATAEGSAVGIAWALVIPALLAYVARVLVGSRSLGSHIRHDRRIP